MTVGSSVADGLARKSALRHPSGSVYQTPMLIPSFSSKGFRVTKERSELKDALELASEWLADVMLISAYDLGFGFIPAPTELKSTPELIVVDSGGYETRVEHDMSTVVHWPHEPLPGWTESKLRTELDKWPDRFPAVFVSYDDPVIRQPIQQQVDRARQLFSCYPKQMHTFLLKPETVDQRLLDVAIGTVERTPHLLAGFSIIGITEKELGNTVLDRMHRIARLRVALDGAGILSPIHVFGALDPITCMLYFISGAEIFDGLTWLRYAFHEGVCVYPTNYGALRVGTSERDAQVRAKMITDNIHCLKKLSTQMSKFLLDKDFKKFVPHADFIESEFDALRSRLSEKGGR